MKRTIQALVVAALFSGTQAMAGGFVDAFPSSVDDAGISVSSKSTYAEQHAAGTAQEAMVSVFPSSVDDAGISVSSTSTYADRHAVETAQGVMVSAFPGSVDDAGISVPSKSTYADQFLTERNRQARGASDPALSE